ncbi:glycine zipper 2TM domain-containing protein [Sulfurisoma sediminicola]|uniref:Outer membrane lipoprotein SlyB n=1 Tax=Sulfurisoma sediminicola TaxID=1381557 RepID=A0A497XE94_9PROT|nr:glycine zipper 2TM domain-containing protein [Sulfurisoma sediminicola]RLJ65332.1 outer membrane lipoprotein SlyB [Sulfurisoma sediminicola]
MENNRPTLHPALMIAAASVTALSLAGVGVLTGVLPFGQKTADATAHPQLAAMAQSAMPTPAGIAPPAAAPTPTVAVNVNNAPAHVAAAPKAAAPKPVRVARNDSDIEVYRSERAPSQIRTAAPIYDQAPPICRDCGTIESVREIAKEGEGSGLGAVAGGVVGGVLGNQVGNGRGRDLATVAGAIGGAFAGHQIEKSQKKVVDYQITVRLEDGTTRVFHQDTAPAWRSGDRVRIENGSLASRA